jgi:hypothetical protein
MDTTSGDLPGGKINMVVPAKQNVIPGTNAIAFARRCEPLRASKDGVQRSACGHPSRRVEDDAHLRMTVYHCRKREFCEGDGLPGTQTSLRSLRKADYYARQ